MRTRSWEDKGELVFERNTMDSTIAYRLGEDKIYVLSDGMLYSMEPDGGRLRSYRAKYGARYASGEQNDGLATPFLLVGEDMIVEEYSAGAFGNAERVLVRVPVDGSPQQKLEIELEAGYTYTHIVYGNTLYLFRRSTIAGEEGESSDVILYDLNEDQVTDIVEGPVFPDFQNYVGNYSGGGGWYLTGTHSDIRDNYASFSISTEVLRLSPENLTGTRIDTVEGDPVTLWGDYMVYQGDYQVFYEEGDPSITDPIPYAESTAYYLRNLKTGAEVRLDLEPHTVFHLNFYPEGLMITRTRYEKTWVTYP